jgi:hypothetical protein
MTVVITNKGRKRNKKNDIGSKTTLVDRLMKVVVWI